MHNFLQGIGIVGGRQISVLLEYVWVATMEFLWAGHPRLGNREVSWRKCEKAFQLSGGLGLAVRVGHVFLASSDS